MLVGAFWLSRVSIGTSYLTGIALPMLLFGVGQGLGLSALTTAGMSGVEHRDAGIAGGLVNVAHHLGGAFGLGILVTFFDAAGSPADGPRQLLADRVSASLTVAAVFLVLALVVTLIAHPRRRAAAADERADLFPLAASAHTACATVDGLLEKTASA